MNYINSSTCIIRISRELIEHKNLLYDTINYTSQQKRQHIKSDDLIGGIKTND